MGPSPTSRSARPVLRGLVAALLGIAASIARADPAVLDALNAARARGCGGKPGLAQALSASPSLNAAASYLEQNVPPGDALPRAGYRATRWLLYAVQGAIAPPAIAGQVAQRNCDQLLDPAYTEVGIHRRGAQTWILLAAPFAPPSPGDAAVVAQRVLELVNAARAQPRACGDKRFEAAGPLRANATLDRAARIHSEDMATKGFFGHDGSDGSTPLIRATRVGYAGRSVGENVAAGQATPEFAVDGWVKSPPHCANLMNPAFTEMGIAYVVNPASPTGIYWTQVFGRPR